VVFSHRHASVPPLETASSSQPSTSTSYQPNILTRYTSTLKPISPSASRLVFAAIIQATTKLQDVSWWNHPLCHCRSYPVPSSSPTQLQTNKALQDIAFLTLSALGLRTRYTRSRPSLRIRTVCQPNVDISMITLECDDLPIPHISSSFLVETSLSTSARILPAFSRFTLPLPFLVRPSCRTMIRTLSPHLSRANNANSGGSSFLASCFISCSLHPSSPSNLRSRV
jgi:hypothetical protein